MGKQGETATSRMYMPLHIHIFIHSACDYTFFRSTVLSLFAASVYSAYSAYKDIKQKQSLQSAAVCALKKILRKAQIIRKNLLTKRISHIII